MFKRYGVPVLEGVHCTSPDEALAAYDQLGSKVVAVKSQIHAGGRGKGNLYAPDSGDLVMEGGVKIAFSREEVGTYASNILGNVLVTIQTGDEGKLVRNLYVESGCAIAHEYYLALLVDREAKSVLIMASTEGGMDIEDVAEATPELIHKIHVDPSAGLLGFQSRDLAGALANGRRRGPTARPRPARHTNGRRNRHPLRVHCFLFGAADLFRLGAGRGGADARAAAAGVPLAAAAPPRLLCHPLPTARLI